MRTAWTLWLFAASALISIICGQIKQSDSWEGGWMAMDEKPQRQSNSENMAELIFSNSRNQNNGTNDINTIITQIIDSQREGRNLKQYDPIYADGNIKQAVQQGNDIEARNVVRDKLCFLGLLSCNSVEKQRPNVIKPPTRYHNYNGASRVPPPSPSFQQKYYNNFGPPRKIGHSQFYSPNIVRPFENPTNSAFYGNRPILQGFQQPNAGVPLPQSNIYHKQPATASSNIVVAVPSSAAHNGMQQHVHHHYHHVEGTSHKVPVSQLNHGSFGQQSPASLSNIGGIHSSVGINNYRPVLNGAGALSGGYNPVYGQISDSFHTQNPAYHKKELHSIGGIAVSSNGGHHSQPTGSIIERQQILNCFCVPFNQCPAADRIGRKEDLILPIDPRNLGKDIDSLADVALSNATKINAHLKRTTREAEPDLGIKTTVTASATTAQNEESSLTIDAEGRAYYGNRRQENNCRPHEICCRRPINPVHQQQLGRCGTRNAAGITGRIKNPIHVDSDSEFGEYPWQVAILKKDPNESIYACGGTLIDALHVITAAHCIKAQNGFDLRARLGEWDVNHDVEFFPYVEREIVSVHIHPQYYAGTLENDLALLKLNQPIDFQQSPHISPACLPDKYADFTGARCWTTGWGKDAFGDHGKYQNILKEVDVPILSHQQCETQLRQTRLGYSYKLSPGFLCAGGEEGKDACKGDGGGPLVCNRNGIWHVVGVVSWGIGCGLPNVPGVYVRVAHYIDWIRQLTQQYI